MHDRLSTLHDAMNDSADDDRPDKATLEPTTFKVQTAIKNQASIICTQNGTTLSSFLRWCCIRLVGDYLPIGNVQIQDDDIQHSKIKDK